MKTTGYFLAFMALIAVNTNAQQTVIENNSPSEKYAVNTVTVSSAHVAAQQVQQTEQVGSDAERTKSFSKSFSVDHNDKVNLNNQYGAITIKTWDRKEVKVDIEIKAYSNSDSDAQKLIDEVSIDANKVGDVVSIKTIMGGRDGRYGRKIKNGVTTWRRELKVSYILYMPAVNPLTVLQQYGNVDMGNFSGPTSLKVQYGNLNAGNLSNANNYINVQYGKATIQEINTATVKHEYGAGVSIGTAGTIAVDAEYVAVNINTIRRSADIKVQYGGGLTVGSILGNLLLNSEYAKVNINSIKGNTVIKQSYGNLALASVGKLSLKTEYTNVAIGALNGDANIDMEYNKISIDDIAPACKNFTFNAEYVSAGFGFGNGYSGNFSVNNTYSGFKYGGNVTANLVSKDDETKRYSGKIGNGSGGNLNIKAEYGSVTFK